MSEVARMQNAASTRLQPVTIQARIGATWRAPDKTREARDPYRHDIVAAAPVSTQRDCEDAIQAAHRARDAMAAMPGYQRAALLRRAADIVEARVEPIACAMARETGKAIRDARFETARSADSLRLCAEEAVRIEGEHVPMDSSAVGAGKIAMVLRFPVGVVAGITPFNAPVNCAAHKAGCALAAGNSFILKPSPKASLCSHLFMEAMVEAGFPEGAISTLYGDDIGQQLVSDPRVGFVTFTGSIRVGKIIRNAVGMKRVALELGGIGPTFVHGDANLPVAAKACARNAMLLAGQSCISVQNVYVEAPIYDQFVELVAREVDLIRFGDPLDPETEVGTLVDEQAAIRVQTTINNAVAGGATLLRGGMRDGALLGPSVAVDVRPDMELVCEELFGPGMTLQPYKDIEPIFRSISDSPVGLQCGIFTNSLSLAQAAIRQVRTGGVIVNGTSRWRSDQMPYGGVKDSGMGREGPKYAVKEMTDERFFVFA